MEIVQLNGVEINNAGAILIQGTVATAPPPPPEGTIAIDVQETGNVSKKGGSNNTNWNINAGTPTVPVGKTIVIQYLEFEAIHNTDDDSPVQTYLDLFWRPNGNSTGEKLITSIYLQHGPAPAKLVNYTVVATASGVFRMKVKNLGSEDIRCFRRFTGYYIP